MGLFFEGAEKKVEIVFRPGLIHLRQFDISYWERVVAKSKASILSHVRNGTCDAYLLSESSLFVYDHSLVMITCGSTALSQAIDEVFTFTNPQHVGMLMYERKNEMAPEHQPSDFDEDMRRLQARFGGDAMVFGRESGNHVKVFHYLAPGFTPRPEDMTLEILMHDLQKPGRGHFEGPGLNRGKIRHSTGIHALFPEFIADDYVFEPMGYSLNAIGGTAYYTVHVTPQAVCSYASFETNRILPPGSGEMGRLLQRVTAIFQPQSFSVLSYSQKNHTIASVPGFRKMVTERRQIGPYGVDFADYLKV